VEQDHLPLDKLDVVNKSRLKYLSITFSVSDLDTDNAKKKCNRLFTFILEKCPLLKEIKLNGNIYNIFGALNLNFRNHSLLQLIDINLKGCRYYTFSFSLGKQWKNARECIMEEDLSNEKQSGLTYHINLVWKDGDGPKLELGDCTV
jgi:hypothetical protein